MYSKVQSERHVWYVDLIGLNIQATYTITILLDISYCDLTEHTPYLTLRSELAVHLFQSYDEILGFVAV